jgi:cell division protein FtsW
MGAGIVLLILLFTPLGTTINAATRWVELGPITFMPGELAKIAIIWFMAWFYTKFAKNTRKFLRGTVPAMIVIAVTFVLIWKQPNLSTALIVAGIALTMMFLGGSRIHHLLALAGAGLPVVYFMVVAKNGEHMSRISNYLDPFSDTQDRFYQTVQGLLALGAGGATGVGPGRSVQKALYLPAAQNDYIFAVIGEELGFIGCIALLILFLALIWRCVLIAMKAPDRFSMMMASGITIMLALQVILNIAVVTNLLPSTGVILPFISFGGNAMLLFMGAMGIMYHISKHPDAAAAAQEAPAPPRKRGSRRPEARETAFPGTEDELAYHPDTAALESAEQALRRVRVRS